MSNSSSRFGSNPEGKKIKRKISSFTLSEAGRNIPLDFNKDSYGALNYDPVYGWVNKNFFGKDAEGMQDGNFSTNYLRRSDGLPGSRP